MITEENVFKLTPSEGFIANYISHGYVNTTAPVGYHLATGLSILSTTCHKDFTTKYAGDLHANLYSMCIGRSGEDQKTTALKIARKILFKVNPMLIGSEPASAEGLIQELVENNKEILIFEEMGKILSKAQSGYFETVKTALTELWDCSPQTMRKAKEKLVLEDPRLSVMAACSIPYLEKYTNPEDWTGGFLGRWFMIYGRRERIDPDPIGNSDAVPYLVDFLKERLAVKKERIGVYMGLTEDAKETWTAWYYKNEKRNLPDKFSGAKTRAPAIARKIAMLYAWDFGTPIDCQTWQLDNETIKYGIKAAELHVASVVGLSGRIAEHSEAIQRREVLDCIPIGGTIRLSDLLEMTKLKKKTLLEQMDGLIASRVVTQHVLNDKDVMYSRDVSIDVDNQNRDSEE